MSLTDTDLIQQCGGRAMWLSNNKRSSAVEIKVAMIKTVALKNIMSSLRDSINEAEGKHRTAISKTGTFLFFFLL